MFILNVVFKFIPVYTSEGIILPWRCSVKNYILIYKRDVLCYDNEKGGDPMHISNKCSIAVHCLIFIHEYGESHKVTSEWMALSSGSNPVTIRNLMSSMKKDGMILVKPGTGGAVLSCPPEEISLYRIWACVEPEALTKMIGIHQSPSPLCPVGQNIKAVLEDSYAKLRSDLEESLRAITLEDILADYHGRAPDNPARTL